MDSFLSAVTRPTLCYPRQADDPDVVALMDAEFKNAGLVFQSFWKDDEIIKPVLNQNPALQRFAVSRFLNLVLLAIPADTMVARICVNSQSPFDEFMANFREHVLPVLVKHYPDRTAN